MSPSALPEGEWSAVHSDDRPERESENKCKKVIAPPTADKAERQHAVVSRYEILEDRGLRR